MRATTCERSGSPPPGSSTPARERVRLAPHLAWRDEQLREAAECARWRCRSWSPTTRKPPVGRGTLRRRPGRGPRVMVTLGTGIGGALLVSGRLHTGRNGMAGEFGHMRVVPDGRPCECGHTGCWEQYSSGKALARFAREAGSADVGQALTDAARVRRAGGAGRRFVEVGRWLGVGLADLVAAFDPDLVLVGEESRPRVSCCSSPPVVRSRRRWSAAATARSRGSWPPAWVHWPVSSVPPTWPPAPRSSDSSLVATVRVMTYNILLSGRRGAPLHDLVRTVAPDVLMVNEAPKRQSSPLVTAVGWPGSGACATSPAAVARARTCCWCAARRGAPDRHRGLAAGPVPAPARPGRRAAGFTVGCSGSSLAISRSTPPAGAGKLRK